MTGYAAAITWSYPLFCGIRQRAVIWMLAATLALMSPISIPTISLGETHGLRSTVVDTDGTRVELACQGRGTSTVVLVHNLTVATIIDAAAQAELARYVRLCTFTVVQTASNHSTATFADVMANTLLTANVPSPYVIVAHASMSTVSRWVHESLARQMAGFVLIDPPSHTSESGAANSAQQPGVSFVVHANGDQRPLPQGDRGEMVLAILSLFWPPEEG